MSEQKNVSTWSDHDNALVRQWHGQASEADMKCIERHRSAKTITHDDMIQWLEAMKASGVGTSSASNRRMCDAIVAVVRQAETKRRNQDIKCLTKVYNANVKILK